VQPGLSYGDALLAPTVLYSPVTEALHAAGVRLHYASNITGHGWRKLLRHPKPLRYRVHTLPAVPPVLTFIQRHAQLGDHEAYDTLNMGAGFALFVPADQAQRTLEVAAAQGVAATLAGVVEAGDKELLIEPLGLRWAGDALQLR
jgi:phosphoribosylformylglycinamidine cyclo-ligase